ncbi:inositol phospholipid synthesis and fat-storage-inducing TM-domain-containing protein [Pyronema domesticum]|nr:inositol phospholipid synthesis and fat-storage-inducing TM-domain-containing protein [Pyronema domesticum]
MEPLPSSSAISDPPSSTDDKPTFSLLQSRPLSGIPLTTCELLAVSIYPLTLLLAQAFQLLSPSPSAAHSYFSQKRNLPNLLFVKYGWFWTTLVFFLHLSRLRHSSRSKAVLRWGIATAWWILVTQWFLGPPLTDRAFLITGGRCEVVQELTKEELVTGGAKMIWTAAACKMSGGKWRGGHDLSGHVFLLTHASLFLWSEVLPVVKKSGWRGMGSKAVGVLLGLWWWMGLMTGVYFHTWGEKVTGLIVAMVQWGALYGWALKMIPSVRMALGVPGL